MNFLTEMKMNIIHIWQNSSVNCPIYLEAAL